MRMTATSGHFLRHFVVIRFATRVFAPCLPVLIVGCRVMRPSDLPRDEPWIIAVKSCRCPYGEPAITHFAHHSWFDVKRGNDAQWVRIEVASGSSGVMQNEIAPKSAYADLRFRNREVRVLAFEVGEQARAQIEPLIAAASKLSQKYADEYVAWPGPNSNTFLSDASRRVDGLAFPLHHNAVSKDFALWIDAGLTTSKTGVRVDTLPIGFALALEEGVELHFLQLTFGISLWPPRLKLPFLPEIPWSSAVVEPVVDRSDETASSELHITMHGAPGRSGSSRTFRDESAGSVEIDIVDASDRLRLSYTITSEPTDGYIVRAQLLGGGTSAESRTFAPWIDGRCRLHAGLVATHFVTVDLARGPDGRLSLAVDSALPP